MNIALLVLQGATIGDFLHRAVLCILQYPIPSQDSISLISHRGQGFNLVPVVLDSHPIFTWLDFVQDLQICFGSTSFDDPVVDFTKLSQMPTVEEYQKPKFEILLNCIPDLLEDFRISTFLSGLRDDILIMVTMFHLTTIPSAFGLTRLYEDEEGVWRRFKH